MTKINEYIVHRSTDMNELVMMVKNSISLEYQPYGNLNVLSTPIDNFGTPDLNGKNSGFTYVQAMVKFAA